MREVLVCLALMLAACGSDATETQTTVDLSTKPEVGIPDGNPPSELVIDDIHVGDGAEAEEGATVTVHYVGVAWSTQEQFDASWDQGEPVTFPLQGVIEGWRQGIPGMREGGRRRLTIPPQLAYGDAPPPGSGISPGETLVFVVDLVEVD